MVIKKCHFDDLFMKIIEEIEDEFDKDFEEDIKFDLEGSTDLDNLSLMNTFRREIGEEMWDIQYADQTTDRAETLIKAHVVFLLYLLKKTKEKKQ